MSSRLAACVFLAAMGVALMASQAAAATLTSATYDPSSHMLTTHWTLAEGECALAVVNSTSSAITEFNNELTDGSMIALTHCGDTSNTVEVTAPGTYYVQLEYHPANSNADVGSNVLSFTVAAGQGGGGGGEEGGGTTGASGESCIATSTCVIPLNSSVVIRGQPYVTHADGSRQRIQDVTEVKAGDWVRTGSNGIARWAVGYSNGTGIAGVFWMASSTSFGFTGLYINAHGLVYINTVIANGEVVFQQLLVEATVHASSATIRVPTPVVHSGATAKARTASASPTFTVAKRGSTTVVEVYAGSVQVSDAHAHHAVTVGKGTETVVRAGGRPSRPRRFKPPKHRFWS